jgi:hypothetical protein
MSHVLTSFKQGRRPCQDLTQHAERAWCTGASSQPYVKSDAEKGSDKRKQTRSKNLKKMWEATPYLRVVVQDLLSVRVVHDLLHLPVLRVVLHRNWLDVLRNS